MHPIEEGYRYITVMGGFSLPGSGLNFFVVRYPEKGERWRQFVATVNRYLKQTLVIPRHRKCPRWQVDGNPAMWTVTGRANPKLKRLVRLDYHDGVLVPFGKPLRLPALRPVPGADNGTETPTMKKNALKVMFRRYPDGSIDALFPESAADISGSLCDSYAHVGQHSAADPQAVIGQTRPATPEEYADLKAELEGIGYKLEVVQRTPPNAALNRLKSLGR